MKLALILPAFLAAATFAQAQCPLFQLSDLQTIQRADPAYKESKIQEYGFDLRSDFVSKGSKIRGFSKCWNTFFGEKTVYEQLIWWNTEANSVTFFTLNEVQFTSLRQSIVERRASGNITENPDIYVGHLFLYHFGRKKVEGVEYYVISIEFKH